MAHATVSPRTYVVVYVTLLGLTMLTAYLGSQEHLGVWELPVALGIATTKTVLVGLFFMHLASSSKLTWLILATGVLFLMIMLVLTGVDYWSRQWGAMY